MNDTAKSIHGKMYESGFHKWNKYDTIYGEIFKIIKDKGYDNNDIDELRNDLTYFNGIVSVSRENFYETFCES